VAFADGQTNATVSVEILDDTTINPDRSFVLQLREPAGGVGIGPTGEVGVTIRNDDYGVEIGSTAIDAHEVEGRVGIPLHRVGAAGEAFSVGLALVAGSAVEGVDYRVPVSPVGFAAAATGVTAWIEIPDNQKPDPPRTFEVRLVDPTARATLAGTARATVTIRDNDHPGGLLPNSRITPGVPGVALWNLGLFTADGGCVVWSALGTTRRLVSFGPDGSVARNTSVGPQIPRALFAGGDNEVIVAGTAQFYGIRIDRDFPSQGATFSYAPYPAGTVPLAVVPTGFGSTYVAAALVSDGTLTRQQLARVSTFEGIDPSFVAAIEGGAVQDLVGTPDGGVIVGGTFLSASGIPREGLARLHADGSVDPNYARRLPGQVTAPAGVAALAPLADGSMYVGGTFATFAGQARAGLVRLDPNGDLDEGFGRPGAGLTLRGGAPAIRQLAVQPDGRLLVLGSFDAHGGRPIASELVRLRPDGTLDAIFDIGATPGIARMRVFGDGTVGIMGSLPSIDGVAGSGPARLWLGPDDFGTPRFARVAAGAAGSTRFEIDRGITGIFALETSDDLRAWNDSGRRVAMPSGWRFDEVRSDAARYYRLKRVP
jgi:hypothetical protein